MTIAYTICSANYLPFAKALADTFAATNPHGRFVIALADTWRGYDAAFFAPHRVIPVEEMQLADLPALNAKYNIFELSCALKPYVAAYLFAHEAACQTLFYFDSDILVYGALSLAEERLQQHPVLLTPHVAKPKPYDASIQTELDVLRTGLYNAGFFGLRRSQTADHLLQWWSERLRHHCYNDAAHGLFVDQLWLDLVPLYFRDTCVLFDPGYNLAYWNFSERKLSERNGSHWVNESHPLIFFHYSGYDLEQPELVSKHHRNATLDAYPNTKPLFADYRERVEQNRLPEFRSLPATMGRPAPVKPPREKNFFKRKWKKWFRKRQP